MHIFQLEVIILQIKFNTLIVNFIFQYFKLHNRHTLFNFLIKFPLLRIKLYLNFLLYLLHIDLFFKWIIIYI